VTFHHKLARSSGRNHWSNSQRPTGRYFATWPTDLTAPPACKRLRPHRLLPSSRGTTKVLGRGVDGSNASVSGARWPTDETAAARRVHNYARSRRVVARRPDLPMSVRRIMTVSRRCESFRDVWDPDCSRPVSVTPVEGCRVGLRLRAR
jgi:hypothetical protein